MILELAFNSGGALVHGVKSVVCATRNFVVAGHRPVPTDR